MSAIANPVRVTWGFLARRPTLVIC